ncbi:MAG TPA: hypothetical protein VMV27_01965 [Candidatus Binataceae bacterium]|nr:hypothetical protein [Candidatus Binataceae bacterium]
MSLLTDLESEVGKFNSDVAGVAALVWGDVKGAVASGEAIAVDDVKAALPKFVAALKDYTSQVVASVQSDPAFAGAVGSWKFGTVCNLIFQAVKSGLPGFEHTAVALGQATVESVVQDSVKGVLAGAVTANPTSSAAKPSAA